MSSETTLVRKPQPHLLPPERPASSSSAASSDRSRYHTALNNHAREALRQLQIGETPNLHDARGMQLLDQQQDGSEVQEVNLRHGFTAQLSAEELRELNTVSYIYSDRFVAVKSNVLLAA